MKMTTLVLTLTLGAVTLANAETLVDVTFDDAVVGQSPPLLDFTPPITSPSHRLVGMNFGELLVVDEIGGMSKAAKFSPGGYCQPVVFDGSLSPTVATSFLFEFDFYLSNFYTRGPQYGSSVDEFVVLFDFPQVIRLNLQTTGNSGRISVGGGGTVLGGFTFDSTHHLAITLDVARQEWSTALDGVMLFSSTGFFAGANPNLTGVRLNLVDDGGLASEPLAYVDNIRLTTVPEPSPFSLTLATVVTMLFVRRSIKSGVRRNLQPESGGVLT